MQPSVPSSRRFLTNTLFAMGIVGCAVAAAACSSKPDPNDPSQMQPSGGYNNGGQYQPNGQYNPNGQYTPTTQPTTPTTQPTATAGGGSAQQIPPAAAMAATPALQVLAGRDAQGMSPDGPAFAGNFQQGQTLEQLINVQSGKCYTIVASGVGITQLDVVVNTAPPAPIPPVPVAQSSSQGPNATVGGGGSCMRSPLPGQFKVVLKATAGAGIAVAQVFSK
jgi:hypothetical protein